MAANINRSPRLDNIPAGYYKVAEVASVVSRKDRLSAALLTKELPLRMTKLFPYPKGQKPSEDLLGSECCRIRIKAMRLSTYLQATSSVFLNLDQFILRYKRTGMSYRLLEIKVTVQDEREMSTFFQR